jgi:hypothetical protein
LPRLNQAYFSAPVDEFLRQDVQTILGRLAQNHPHDLDPLQRNTWLEQIALLQRELSDVADGWIAFEFSIPRMGKRADAIVILNGIIFVLEFKVGAHEFSAQAIEQVTDYALDLKNFHEGSYSRIIVPVLIATKAYSKPVQLTFFPNTDDRVAEPILVNSEGLGDMLTKEAKRFCDESRLDPVQWLATGYKPTPTIIEAAQALYNAHQVEDITRNDAGIKNLSATTERLAQIIDAAKTQRQKVICFVTGVPGAGKTLAGLNLVTGRLQKHADEHAVVLSGNGPLVDVLREALAQDQVRQATLLHSHLKAGDARRRVKSFIQNIHHFRDEYLRSEAPPVEQVVVFDEAQRAWNRSKIERFMRERKGVQSFEKSEPEFLIDVMNRHQSWCVVVCLVGGGQEINDGEAGLLEWFDALKRSFPDWLVHTSSQLEAPLYTWGHNLAARLAGLQHFIEPDLHLAVSVRSFRAESLARYIDAVVGNNAKIAREMSAQVRDTYPIFLTRDLAQARIWLRSKARGSERFGLVASSGASRLKPEGVNVHEKIDAPSWFLKSKSDVRSSYYLEDPATEFDIQGLELDWIGVCWDADYRWTDGRWSHHDFVGTNWRTVRDPSAQRYLENAYRVLLTRARQGMIIYVPRGSEIDPTRKPVVYDEIASHLLQCGIAEL